MTHAAVAVGRLGPDGPWIGFAPSAGGGFDLLAGDGRTVSHATADADDLVSLAIAFFEDSLTEPPEDLAATLGDIGGMVRSVAHRSESERHARFAEAVDAVDDGLAADVVVSRLAACLDGREEPIARLERRAIEMLGPRGS